MNLNSFWEEFPDADIIPQFKALRNKRGDEPSSRMMWYLRLMNDPEHEYVSKIPKKERHDRLAEYCQLKKSDFSSALFKEAEKFYTDKWLSKPKRLFKMFEDKGEEAERALRDGAIYSPEDIAVFTKALQALRDYKREYEEAQAMFREDVKKTKFIKAYGKEATIGTADTGDLFA